MLALFLNMRELDAILALYGDVERRGAEAILATVVDVQGSAYRSAGARMLVSSDGRRAGSVSGGCLEADIAKKGWWWTESGTPAVRTYDTVSNEDTGRAFGLGCNGLVRVLVERTATTSCRRATDFLRFCSSERMPGVMATVISSPSTDVATVGDRWFLKPNGQSEGTINDMMIRDWTEAEADAALVEMQSRMLAIPHARGPVEVFVEVIPPAVSLIVFGAGQDALPLVSIAKELGWRVAVADARPSLAQTHRFPHADRVVVTRPDDLLADIQLDAHTIAVVMNHNYDVDQEILRGLLDDPLPYIGMLGPRRRTEQMLEEMGVSEIPRNVHAPAGLDIGGEAPEPIALSILAEAQAVLAKRHAGMLRDRRGAIHDRAEPETQIAMCA